MPVYFSWSVRPPSGKIQFSLKVRTVYQAMLMRVCRVGGFMLLQKIFSKMEHSGLE